MAAPFLFLLLLVPTGPAAGQQGGGELTESEREAVQDSLVAQLRRIYVFEDRAEIMAERLRDAFANGSLDEIRSPGDLGPALTKLLFEVAADRHLRVWAAAAPAGSAPPTEQAERDRARAQQFGLGADSILPGNVGYLEVKSFNFDADHVRADFAAHLATVMDRLAGVDALIVDVRANGGGHPGLVAVLSSYLFDDEPVHLNSLYWRAEDRTDVYTTDPSVPGRKLGSDMPVYVLTSRRTFSGAEEFAYNLKALGRATIVGERTGGGAHPGSLHRVGTSLVAFIPGGRAVNPITGTNWEGVGVEPDVEVPAGAALARALALIGAAQAR